LFIKNNKISGKALKQDWDNRNIHWKLWEINIFHFVLEHPEPNWVRSAWMRVCLLTPRPRWKKQTKVAEDLPQLLEGCGMPTHSAHPAAFPKLEGLEKTQLHHSRFLLEVPASHWLTVAIVGLSSTDVRSLRITHFSPEWLSSFYSCLPQCFCCQVLCCL